MHMYQFDTCPENADLEDEEKESADLHGSTV